MSWNSSVAPGLTAVAAADPVNAASAVPGPIQASSTAPSPTISPELVIDTRSEGSGSQMLVTSPITSRAGAGGSVQSVETSPDTVSISIHVASPTGTTAASATANTPNSTTAAIR